MIYSCALARVEALRAGKEPVCAVLDVARETLEESLGLLEANPSSANGNSHVLQSEQSNVPMHHLVGDILVSRICHAGPFATLSNYRIREVTLVECMTLRTTGLRDLRCDRAVSRLRPVYK